MPAKNPGGGETRRHIHTVCHGSSGEAPRADETGVRGEDEAAAENPERTESRLGVREEAAEGMQGGGAEEGRGHQWMRGVATWAVFLRFVDVKMSRGACSLRGWEVFLALWT